MDDDKEIFANKIAEKIRDLTEYVEANPGDGWAKYCLKFNEEYACILKEEWRLKRNLEATPNDERLKGFLKYMIDLRK
jgi:hypothetical protein